MKPTDEEILKLGNVPILFAAQYIDKRPAFVRLGLQQRSLFFGSAVQNESGKWSYHISPGLLVAYQRGTLKIEVKAS